MPALHAGSDAVTRICHLTGSGWPRCRNSGAIGPGHLDGAKANGSKIAGDNELRYADVSGRSIVRTYFFGRHRITQGEIRSTF